MLTRPARSATLLAATATSLLLALLPATTATADTDGVCDALDSGKIDTKGDPQSVAVSAPDGRTITGYCVKAGSTNAGDGPVYVDLATEVTTLVVRHPSGKAVSHYSVRYDVPPGTDPPPVVPPPPPGPPFDWDWPYPPPVCDALIVTYPTNLPQGQANDVNVRFRTPAGQFTLNFHNNDGFWSGTTSFPFTQHPDWPAGLTSYAVEWVQVGGTNYHWEGRVRCLASSGSAITRAVTGIAGWRGGVTRIRRGTAPRASVVTVDQPGLAPVVLQRRAPRRWVRVKQLRPNAAGTVRVVLPRQRKRGRKVFRVQVAGTESVTGATSKRFVVRVR
ncbi:MAG: hypothetical protein Q8Q02_01990 [Nocardioides sp.]|nr:hypothetical protein [Nocardioides sp.]